MIVLMNGPAKAGKTTLSQELAARFGWKWIDISRPFKKYVDGAAVRYLSMTAAQIREVKDSKRISGASFRDAYIKAADALECLEKSILMRIALENFKYVLEGGSRPTCIVDSCSKIDQLEYVIEAFPSQTILMINVYQTFYDRQQGTFGDGRHNLIHACKDTEAHKFGRLRRIVFMNPGAGSSWRDNDPIQKEESISSAVSELATEILEYVEDKDDDQFELL